MDVGLSARNSTNWPMSQSGLLDPLRDLLILKTALDRKDFQTARREASELQAEPPAATPPSPQPRTQDLSAASGVILDVATLEVVHVEATLQTPEGTLQFEATRVRGSRVTVAASAALQSQKKDPLVIDLTGEGPATTGLNGAPSFDLEGSGKSAPTSTVTDGTAFLALDRNHNGTIDNGMELFGDQHGATDGYEELRKFDSDGNGRIDVADPVFRELRLLQGNGQLSTLGEKGITSISLDATAAPGLTSGGDAITRRATAQGVNGASYQTYALQLQRVDQTA